jgi:PAS domain S-box-containing protein
MKDEPDIIRILREEEKHEKLMSNDSVTKQELEISESTDEYMNVDSSLNTKNENYEIENLNEILSDSNYKVFSDLMEIINFTEKLSASIHGDFTQEEIIRIIINEFKKSTKYTGSILFLSDDGKKLRIAGTSSYTNNLKRAEKISGHKINSYKISLKKSKIYSQVIHEGKTVHFKIIDLLEEIFPKKLALFISEVIKIDKKTHVATPLKVDGRIIGAFAMSTTMLNDFFIPSVKNLAIHISYAFEHANNILEQKTAQVKISQSEQLYRSMVERAPLGIFTVDTRGVVTSCNEAFIKMAGYPQEELVGKNIVYFPTLRKRDMPKYLKMFKSILKGDVPKPFEFYWVTKKGDLCTGELFISLIKINNKITGIQAVIRDISETKNAMVKQKDAEEQYKTLAETLADGILKSDAKGFLTYVNPSLLKMFGYNSSETIGTHFKKYLTTKSKLKAIKLFANILRGKSEKNVEYEAVHKDKHTFPIEVSSSPVIVNKKITGMTAIVRDITDRKKAEKELEEAHKKLQNLNKDLEKKVEARTAEVKKLLIQKDAFINQLGHDLKSPLSPLIGLLPLLEKTETDPKSKELISILCRSVDRIKNIVFKTLELAELSTPSIEFNIENINLWKEAENSIKYQQLICAEKDSKVENKIDENIIVKADRIQLYELFNNIIINAVKYSLPGADIIIDANSDGDFVTVSIADSGVGMTKEQLDQIFDEFYKADESRHDFRSSGLGLSICKRIVEKHGGKIWAESSGLGKGSTFYFTIPSGSKITKDYVKE